MPKMLLRKYTFIYLKTVKPLHKLSPGCQLPIGEKCLGGMETLLISAFIDGWLIQLAIVFTCKYPIHLP